MSSAFTNIATKAAYLAGNFIQQNSRHLYNIRSEKNAKYDFAMGIKKQATDIIIKTLLNAFPEHNISSHDIKTNNKKSDFTWIINPIVGVDNYIRGNPNYATSIAIQQKNKTTHGVILHPSSNDLYLAELGKGGYLNDKRIRVATLTLENSIIAISNSTTDSTLIKQYINVYQELQSSTKSQRMTGCSAIDLAYVATGYIDGFLGYELSSYSVAAGCLLVKESGGMVTNFQGVAHNGGDGNIIATNAKNIIHLQKITQNNTN